jgi:hypothetical protein
MVFLIALAIWIGLGLVAYGLGVASLQAIWDGAPLTQRARLDDHRRASLLLIWIGPFGILAVLASDGFRCKGWRL